MSNKMKSFIDETSQENQRNQKHFKIFGTIDLFIMNELPKKVDILRVIEEVEEKIPFHLTNEVEIFYVGAFKEFQEKQVNAMYKNGAIYITNDQDNIPDMVDDVIHEIAHAAEHVHARTIYSDNKIQNEFLGKRERLKDMIQEYGYLDGKSISFDELEYSKELDDYLYKDLGYDKLETFCLGLFIKPYAVTDIREYFATALEEYLLGDREYTKRISPIAYEKVHVVCKGEV